MTIATWNQHTVVVPTLLRYQLADRDVQKGLSIARGPRFGYDVLDLIHSNSNDSSYFYQKIASHIASLMNKKFIGLFRLLSIEGAISSKFITLADDFETRRSKIVLVGWLMISGSLAGGGRRLRQCFAICMLMMNWITWFQIFIWMAGGLLRLRPCRVTKSNGQLLVGKEHHFFLI